MSVLVEEFTSSAMPQTAGAILAAARRRQNLDVAEISSRLRLSQWQVEALENDQYERLAGPTFIRGIIRIYAKSLQINPQPALDAYGHFASDTEHVRINVPSQNIRFDARTPTGWSVSVKGGLTILALAVVGAGSWLWYTAPAGGTKKLLSVPGGKPVGEVAPSTTASPQAKPTPTTSSASVAPSTPSVTTSTSAAVSVSNTLDVGAMPVQSDTVLAASQTAASPVIPAATPPAGPALHLSFQKEAWVEIKDGKGKTVFRQLNRAGAEQIVTGTPPFDLIIGNAASVTLSYNDKPIDLAPHTRVNVARLTIE